MKRTESHVVPPFVLLLLFYWQTLFCDINNILSVLKRAPPLHELRLHVLSVARTRPRPATDRSRWHVLAERMDCPACSIYILVRNNLLVVQYWRCVVCRREGKEGYEYSLLAIIKHQGIYEPSWGGGRRACFANRDLSYETRKEKGEDNERDGFFFWKLHPFKFC